MGKRCVQYFYKENIVGKKIEKNLVPGNPALLRRVRIFSVAHLEVPRRTSSRFLCIFRRVFMTSAAKLLIWAQNTSS